jgi:hypothetical protein
MAFDYARLKDSADRLLVRFGQAAVLRRPSLSGTAYNPTVGTATDYDVTAAVFDFKAREVDGARIRTGDKRVLLAKESLAIAPTTADKMVIGGVEHAIINVKTTSPAGTVILWEVQARR